MRIKKSIAFLLSLMMMLSIVSPFSVAAETSAETPTITVQSLADTAGATINVNVVIENNPGILGATLEFEYDEGLTLLNATAGDAFSALTMTKPGKFTSPCKFVWDGQEISSEDVKDGTILTLQFKIDENSDAGDDFEIDISYENGDILDANLCAVDVDLISGCISVVDFLPGDLDGDSIVNTRDIILLRRDVAGGYEQVVNTAAGDVNNDGKRNTLDIIYVRRYVAGGYDIDLVPSRPQCEHVMTENPYNAPNCTEAGNIAYWSCSKCNKLFSDKDGASKVSQEDTIIKATGHTIVVDQAVQPTYESTGLTEGKHCSSCNTVIIKQEVIPKLEKETYSITYYVDNNDEYLTSISIDNPNPFSYSKEDGLVLQDLIVRGYNFVGWYTAQTGGERVTEIKAGETGNKTLYAHWEKVTYTISFASDMVPVNSISYSVGEEKPLPKPTLDKYTFVGWSDKDGKMWDNIPAGTIGNITLYANWASNRNKAVAKATLADPIICEDPTNGIILFTYEIGEIKNVPLFTMFKLNCANGIISSTERLETDEILESQAKTIASTVSKATTDSASWTLSKDWNQSTEVSKTYLEETGQTKEEAETLAKSSSNTYNLTNSNGGSSGCTNTSSGSFKLSGNQAHSDSTTDESGQNFGLSVDAKYSRENSAGISLGLPEGVGSVNVGRKSGFEIGGGVDYSNYGKTSTTGTDSWSNTIDMAAETSNTSTSSKTWNTSEGFSSSNSVSKSSTVSNTISSLVSEQYGYGSSYAEGGSNSEAKELATTDSKSDEYSAAVTYNSSKIVSTRTEYSSTGNTFGDYRLVMAGTVHVFAVVGYDIATNSYFTYTYNVMDDKTEEYLDYSFDGSFNDYETTIIPFEIPYFVNEYVNNRIATTDGFRFDPDTGKIVGYTPTGDEPDTMVVIPSYISVDNNDGTFKAVKVTGIKEGLFKNNTDIVAVQLGNYITEIPDSTFEGCTSLKAVLCPGVTKIGNNAFSGCESLSKFAIPTNIVEVGENAFANAPEIVATAANSNVASAVASSGALNITLDIAAIPADDANDMTFEIGEIESFELQGKDKEYKGLSVESNADTTIINGITFTENKKVPLELTSPNVTLDRVTVDCSGYAAIFKADNTNLLLNRTVNLLSSTEHAVVTKNLSLASLSNNIVGKLNVTGNILVCGEITDDEESLNITDGEVIVITAEEFENYINSHKVSFDANGGTVSETSRMVAMNSSIGTLPVPSRDYYSFDGWYTEADGGDEITAETLMTSLTDITVYAHWTHNDAVWAKAADVPADAEVVNRKWTYTLTSYTTSSSSSLSGWTKYDTTWKWSSYGNWSSWQDSYVGSSDSREVKTQSVVSHYNKKTQWFYNRYYGWSSSKGYYLAWGYKTGTCTTYEETGWLDYSLPYQQDHGCGKAYGYNQISGKYIYWYNEQTRQVDNYNSPVYKTQYSYRDRSKIYTYYYKKAENKEATSMPSGSNISNVQEYVQYRTK